MQDPSIVYKDWMDDVIKYDNTLASCARQSGVTTFVQTNALYETIFNGKSTCILTNTSISGRHMIKDSLLTTYCWVAQDFALPKHNIQTTPHGFNIGPASVSVYGLSADFMKAMTMRDQIVYCDCSIISVRDGTNIVEVLGDVMQRGAKVKFFVNGITLSSHLLGYFQSICNREEIDEFHDVLAGKPFVKAMFIDSIWTEEELQRYKDILGLARFMQEFGHGGLRNPIKEKNV